MTKTYPRSQSYDSQKVQSEPYLEKISSTEDFDLEKGLKFNRENRSGGDLSNNKFSELD